MSIEKKKQNVVHKKKKTLLKTIIIRKKGKFFRKINSTNFPNKPFFDRIFKKTTI